MPSSSPSKRGPRTTTCPRSAFVSMGVERSVLQEAGVLSLAVDEHRAWPPRKATTRAVTVDRIKEGVLGRSEPFTLAVIASQVSGGPMTVRKAVNELVGSGQVSRLGPNPEWSGPGRAPLLFKRA